MRNELPKFFEQILNVNEPWEIVNINNCKIEGINSKLSGFTK